MPSESAQPIDCRNLERPLAVPGRSLVYMSLDAFGRHFGFNVDRLPITLKILLENQLRAGADLAQIAFKFGQWPIKTSREQQLAFWPSRILMQDMAGLAALVDLAALRDSVTAHGYDAKCVNPTIPVDLVIDHSIAIDHFGSPAAFQKNLDLEFGRNGERYRFFRWAQSAFDGLRVIPSGIGICHQVNLEYLSQVVSLEERADTILVRSETSVGTDSHTTMINSLGVLGWGVGGIEALAGLLGRPLNIMLPDVVACRLSGQPLPGILATDIVLAVTQQLRVAGVVDCFVEFCGDGLDHLSAGDRATLANMAPEYGATCGFFPIDAETMRYLSLTGRDESQIACIESYAKAQGLWRGPHEADIRFSRSVEIDLSTITANVAGPRRPDERVALADVPRSFDAIVPLRGHADPTELSNGAIAIAAITSCTNTSNPSVMIAAGLLARNARRRGLHTKPWVKTSLAPGARVVADYLARAGLQSDLDALGFHAVAFGCTTCVGNSGEILPDAQHFAANQNGVLAAVLSGNRNFDGRIHPDIHINYLASPPLVIAFALAGTIRIDLDTEPLGRDLAGTLVYLRDIWPSDSEIAQTIESFVTPDLYRKRYSDISLGTANWQELEIADGASYAWDGQSSYLRPPSYVANDRPFSGDIVGARALAILGDRITTDHISPVGRIEPGTPAALYLDELGVLQADYNTFGARRGNHEVMVRGTFCHAGLRNEMVGQTGSVTRLAPDAPICSIYDAAMEQSEQGIDLIVVAGRDYGAGSARDWAAKGTRLLGIRAVIAESFERIHRANLAGMGVLPLEFRSGTNRTSLNLTGTERYDIVGLTDMKYPRSPLILRIRRANGAIVETQVLCRLDSLEEIECYRSGGILPHVAADIIAQLDTARTTQRGETNNG